MLAWFHAATKHPQRKTVVIGGAMQAAIALMAPKMLEYFPP